MDRFVLNDLNGRKCRVISTTHRNEFVEVESLGNIVRLEDLETGEEYSLFDWEITEIK